MTPPQPRSGTAAPRRRRTTRTPSMWTRLATATTTIAATTVILSSSPYIPAVHAANGDASFTYKATSDISQYLKLADDIMEMRGAANMADRQDIYTSGKHSSLTLQSLSTDAGVAWKDVPFYNLYLSAFRDLGVTQEGDGEGLFDGSPAEEYANTLVEDLFSLQVKNIEATGAVVLNVMMTYWGTLWQMLQHCKYDKQEEALKSLDISVGLWIGDRQVRNDNEKGYLLYNMAEVAGAFFGQDQDESLVNSEVMEIVLGIQTEVKAGKCSEPAYYATARNKVQILYQLSNVVLVQMMLFYIEQVAGGNLPSDFVELFALAIVPQVAACDTGLANEIMKRTVSNDLTAVTKLETIALLQQSYSCLGISCADVGAYESNAIPQCSDNVTPKLTGYQPSMDVREVSYIDRDILHMRIFMQHHTLAAALDYYEYGWNANNITLMGIASNSLPWTSSSDYTVFENYYGDDSLYGFGDKLIYSALDADGALTFASEEERMGLVSGALESMVMYLGVIGQVTASIDACDADNAGKALEHWDSAAALLVGSLEGSESGGQRGGQSLYAVSKELCVAFGTCEQSSSVVDDELLVAWQGGVAGIQAGECEQTKTVLVDNILSTVLVPIVQGLLYYSVEHFQNTEDGNLKGRLIAYTQTILPYVHQAALADKTGKSSNSAAQLQANIRSGQGIDISSTFEAIRNALPAMYIDCTEVGQITLQGKLTGVCAHDTIQVSDVVASSPTESPTNGAVVLPAPTIGSVVVPPVDPTGIAWGRYGFVNTGVAQTGANFALDVSDMWNANSPGQAESIYTNDSKHATSGLAGVNQVRSLQDFSTEASLFMQDDPMYNFYRVALFEDSSFDTDTVGTSGGWPYADSVELLAIGPANGNSAKLGAETVVVMEIWMMIVNRLYEAVRTCDNGASSGAELIDLAVGLWIGENQMEGSHSRGWSMYNVAQDAERLYGHVESEAVVNTKLMKYFNEAQTLSKACPSDSSKANILRAHIDLIIRTLSIPLLQNLLFHMSDDNFEMVELYALSFIPQVISVNEGAFEFLRNSLFKGFSWENSVSTKFLTTFGLALHSLRFQCGDLGDTSDSTENLKGLVAALCLPFDKNLIAAYETTNDVQELARIDLDILQIDLFMRANAKNLALDVYMNGRNSNTGAGNFISLQSIALSDDNKAAGSLWDLYNTFFTSDTYANDVIMQAVQSTDDDRFAKASRLQRSEAVRGTLQTMVMYVHIVAQLHLALNECDAVSSSSATTSTVAGQNHVDQAVALFVGSAEGPYSGGDVYAGGQMMYALGKRMCSAFGTCESHGDANSNVELLFSFSSMKESLDELNCDAAQSYMEDEILAKLPVSLIQGVLFYSYENRGLAGPNDAAGALAVSDVLAETLLPQIVEANQTSGAILFDSDYFAYDQPAVSDGTQAVFDAIAVTMEGLGVDCKDIGTLASAGLSACRTDSPTLESDGTVVIAPPLKTPTSLGVSETGDNLYVSTTYVQDRANIALDIKDMEENIALGHLEAAKLIYSEGRNSPVYDSAGKEIDLRSIGSFSTFASVAMVNNPVYQVAVYALQDEKGKYLGARATSYADTIVQEMFHASSQSGLPLAAEAAVALNVWMELVNELFEMVTNCKNQNLGDDDGVHSIDEAVAYWFGDGQIAGDANNGHLLYALAESMGHHFSINSTGQSRTNINILRLFHQAKMELGLANACAEEDTARVLRRIVDKVVSLMVVVNIQALIHYLQVDNERDRVRVYAHAFVPLVAGCSPETFQFLKGKLIDAPYEEVDVELIIAAIRSTFPCFGITCDDVGVHFSETSSACTDPIRLSPLADYRPANDVREYAKLDLDILELDILLQMKSFDAAEELYTFGKQRGSSGDNNSVSLEYLATSSGRSVVPEFDTFRRHFDNDDNYANTIVRDSLISSDFGETQRRAVVIATSQYMIMYMAALQAMHDAINSCIVSGSERGSTAAVSWDKAAAFLVGHLEGTKVGGSEEGKFFLALSKEYCKEFGTCSELELASTKTNDKIVELLYAGRSAILSGSCEELRKATSEIEPLLLIPLLQASLSSAVPLAQRSSKNKELLQGRAYVFAQALLPLIEDLDHNAAHTIRHNFPLEGVAMTDGVSKVAAAFSSVVSRLDVSCLDIGESREINPCTGEVRAKGSQVGLVAGIIVGCVAVFVILILLRSRRRKLLPENSPNFVVPKGELNHTTNMLAPRTPDSTRSSFDGSSDGHDEDDDDEYVKAIEEALVGDSDKEQLELV